MTRLFGKPMISQQELSRRIKDLGRRISEDYQDRDVVMIGVLKGAFAFFADLVRAVHVPVELDFLVVSSYQSSSKSTGRVKVISDLTVDIKGQDVIVVEDIVDSGLTLSFFTIPNKYVVGYGLDYQNHYRNLPYIAVLDQDGEQE
jgi:hypoxanthine phosphoribosyltransferase